MGCALRQTTAHSLEQRLNRLDCLIPHVRDPETFPFDLPVATVDLETEFIPQFFGKLGNIDLSIVPYAGEGHGPKTVLGEELETVLFHPFMHDRIGLPM